LAFGEHPDFFYHRPVACDCEPGRPVLVAGVHDGTDKARVGVQVCGKVSSLVVGDWDGDSHLIVASHLGHWPSYALRILLPMYHSHLGHRVTLPQSVLVVSFILFLLVVGLLFVPAGDSHPGGGYFRRGKP